MWTPFFRKSPLRPLDSPPNGPIGWNVECGIFDVAHVVRVPFSPLLRACTVLRTWCVCSSTSQGFMVRGFRLLVMF
jgi:hypothetical protein